MIERKRITPEAARLRMADLCARSEHCAHEIREKLRKLGVQSSETDRIIAELEERGFIDETRFASSFARDKVRFSGWGRVKVIRGLALKRISSDVAREAMSAVDEEDYERALMGAARVKARYLDLDDYTDRMRLMRHLASKGFTASEASSALSRIREEE